MAVDLETKKIVRRESIARVELFTDANLDPADWVIRIHFETGSYDDQGHLIGPTQFGTTVVTQRFGDVAGDEEVLRIVEGIKTKAYAWRTDQKEKEAAAAEAAAAEAAAAEVKPQPQNE